MSRHHLAQLNVGVIKAPLDSPVMADFDEAMARFAHLREHGPTPRAFQFRYGVPASGRTGAGRADRARGQVPGELRPGLRAVPTS